jgi:hypothetical protein
MNLESVGRPKKKLYAVSRLAASKCIVFMQKFSWISEVTGRTIWATGVATALGTMPWNGAWLGCNKDLDNPIWSKVFKKQNAQGTASIDEDSVELDILDDGADFERIPPWLQYKVWVVTVVKGDGDLGPLKVLRGGGLDHHDLPGCEFLLPPWLIRIGATIDVVDLLVSLGEVILKFFGLFLLISPFGRLEYFIYEIMELVVVLGLVLSLGVEDADAVQEAFEFTRPRPVLLVASWLFHRIDRTINLALLVMTLGRARLVRVAWVLFLLLFPGVEGRFFGQGILISDGENCLWRPGGFQGELTDQGWVLESFLEEHDNGLVIDLSDDIPLIAETLDELSEGLSLLLNDDG